MKTFIETAAKTAAEVAAMTPEELDKWAADSHYRLLLDQTMTAFRDDLRTIAGMIAQGRHEQAAGFALQLAALMDDGTDES